MERDLTRAYDAYSEGVDAMAAQALHLESELSATNDPTKRKRLQMRIDALYATVDEWSDQFARC